MTSKLSFFMFFVFNAFFIISGLNKIYTAGDALTSLIFLIFTSYLIWSVNKVVTYYKGGVRDGFWAYYFKFLLDALLIIGKEKRLGTNKFFRYASVFLSACGAFIAFSIVIYGIINSIDFTQGLFLHFFQVILYIVIYPLLYLILHQLIFPNFQHKIQENLRRFLGLKFMYLFVYIFTFLDPIFGWLFILFIIWIETKITLSYKQNAVVTV